MCTSILRRQNADLTWSGQPRVPKDFQLIGSLRGSRFEHREPRQSSRVRQSWALTAEKVRCRLGGSHTRQLSVGDRETKGDSDLGLGLESSLLTKFFQCPNQFISRQSRKPFRQGFRGKLTPGPVFQKGLQHPAAIGVLSRVEDLGDKLRMAMDAGARRVLIRTENSRDFATLPAEVLDKLRIEFYSEPSQAALKALAE